MAVAATDIWLDSLASKVQRHVVAQAVRHNFHFATSVGPCYLCITCKEPAKSASNDSWVGVFVHWDGPDSDAPNGVCYSLALNALKGAQRQELREHLAVEVPKHTWRSNTGWGTNKFIRWSELCRAVSDGFRLQATVLLLSAKRPACAADAVRVPAPTHGLAFGPMLNGPFTDFVVKAGAGTPPAQRAFAVHRVVLAAASPVLGGMLGSDMREAHVHEVELRDANPDAVELLLTHVYGGDVIVPLALALPLYALADQYQLRSDLAQQLRLWLATVPVQLPVLCQLLPAAHRVCGTAFGANLCVQAAAALGELAPGVLAGWPVDVLVEVMGRNGKLLTCFQAALSWMEVQHQPAKQRHQWERLLSALDWDKATQADLRAIRRHAASAQVPGLHERLWDTLDEICTKQQQLLTLQGQEQAAGAGGQQGAAGSGGGGGGGAMLMQLHQRLLAPQHRRHEQQQQD